MSHSQWEKKKYKKAASEGKTSQMYTKLVKLITMEAKKANGNRDAQGLKQAILKARDVDMPSDNIERAIKKATEAGAIMEMAIYEGYGVGGVGFVIEVLTNNKNKTSQEMKYILSKHGGALGAINSVAWNFTKTETEHGHEWMPNMFVPVESADKEILMKMIEELETNEDVQSVFTNGEGLEE